MTNTSMLERCPFVGAVLSVFIVVGVLTVFGLACFGGYALWLLAFGR